MACTVLSYISTILYVLFLTRSLQAQGMNVGSRCILRNNTIGECRLFRDCPEALIKVRGRLSFDRFTRCGFIYNDPIICCPQFSSTTTTTTTSKSTSFDPDGFVYPEENENSDNSISPTTISSRLPDIPGKKAKQACADYDMTVPVPVGTYILGGEEAGEGEFPHMVALGYNKDTGLEYNCGGTLISNIYVLTAAHCVQNIERIPPTVAKIGTSYLLNDDDSTNYAIVSSIPHPSYNRSMKYHDLALLRLNRPVEFTTTAHPACLNTEPESSINTLIITGWGTIDTKVRSKSDTLQKANVTMVNLSTCNSSYTERRDRKLPYGLTSQQMCAVHSVADTCQGDSGGPIQIPETRDRMYTLVGITSFGQACGSGIPGVYVRISSYLSWIESIVWP
ncbi:serine protease persephone-like isoform X2 [Arctopsyche grandis]|uniref:serine protease persephone-like isoform X2 n=1 Tax=Arctopsyche grandis TaxID=121162 RepID=UPI00406D7CBE